MVDAPPLRQVAGLQRVDEAAPPRDLHENGEAWGDTDTMPPRDLQLVHRLYLPISPHISCAISNMSFSLETSFFFISLTCEMQGDAGRCMEMQGDAWRCMEMARRWRGDVECGGAGRR